MSRQTFGRLFAFAFAVCLLNGCRSDFHLMLYNNTDDPVILRRRDADRTPIAVYAELSGEISGVSTDEFSVERNGRLLRYRLPSSYLYPSAAVPGNYERRVPHVGRSVYFQLAPDNRIYLLRRKDALDVTAHPAQPAGFPLVPR